MKTHPKTIALAIAALAITLSVGCKGVDLAAMQAKATGLATKYAPQLESGLTSLQGLLKRTDELPKDMPVVGGLVEKLKTQGANLEKVKGMLAGLSAQVATAAKDGKGDADITKLLGDVDAQVGTELGQVTTALTEVETGVATAETEVKAAALKGAVDKLGETVGAPLAVQMGKIDELVAKAKAMPPETVGVEGIIMALQGLKAEGEKAKATLDGVAVKVTEAGADAAAAQAVIDAATTEVGATTTKLEGEVTGLAEKLAGLVTDAAAAEFVKALSTGFEVKGAGSGIESQLLAFVEDTTKVVDKTTWFNFDRVVFETGSAKLDVENSKLQLTNIVEIMKAYPTAKLKVGGYTDNTGSAEANKKISQQRAEAVVAMLVELGIDKGRLEAEGYGPDHPVCEANDTEECRAQNRRIAVRVTEK